MSKLTVVSYHAGMPANNTNKEKPAILDNFIHGVNAVGDHGISHYLPSILDCDVAVIQGFVHEHSKDSPHLRLRGLVVETQLRKNKYVVTADSNLFLYVDKTNSMHYLRYSFNGVFPNTGIYCDTNIDPTRWQKISRNLNISLKDYRTSGNHILLCLQRNGGWSMGPIDVQDWANETIHKIRQYTDRPIVVRLHPGDKGSREAIKPGHPKCKIKFSKDVRLSTNEKLTDDLKNCWAAINYNSSPVVGAAIEGVPIFVLDPAKSQCAEIANTDLTQIENPQLLDRQKWAERLSMFHWNFDELRSGECWTHMKKFVL
jgi:hypothetical protein